MNTPRKKPIKRYSNTLPANRPRAQLPDGGFSGGLWNDEHAKLVGQITTYLPQIEEYMIKFMALLLGDPKAPARQIFRALVSEQARIQVMRALLQQAPQNKDKGIEYDDLIDKFAAVKTKRNAYVHGIWLTHDSSGRTFLSEASPDEMSFFGQREVTAKELQSALDECSTLFRQILTVIYPGISKPPLPDTQLPPPPSENS